MTLARSDDGVFLFHFSFFPSLPENLVEPGTLAGWEPVKITINRDKLIGFKN
jgi:hypothetical protein